MKVSRRLKALVYWMILIGYAVSMFYMWINFKREMREGKAGKGYNPSYKVND